MSALVKVWNDNDYPHKERFKGQVIEIPAHSFVEMDYFDAVDFKGQFTGVAPTGPDGGPDKRFFKMIRVERPSAMPFQEPGLVCHADGRKASSDAELRSLLELHKDKLVKDEDAERAMKQAQASSDAKIAAMEREIAELKALVRAQAEKRGPGRPPKGEVAL